MSTTEFHIALQRLHRAHAQKRSKKLIVLTCCAPKVDLRRGALKQRSKALHLVAPPQANIEPFAPGRYAAPLGSADFTQTAMASSALSRAALRRSPYFMQPASSGLSVTRAGSGALR